MLIIETENLGKLPKLVSASLTQSGTGESVLQLEFGTYDGLDWLGNKEPVTLLHHGTPLFHGKVRRWTRSLRAGEKRTLVEVVDMFSLLERLPLAAQVAELEAQVQAPDLLPDYKDWTPPELSWMSPNDPEYEREKSSAWKKLWAEYNRNLWAAAQAALESWESLAESFQINVPGWAVRETESGSWEPDPEAQLTLDVTRARYGASARWNKDSQLSAWQALMKMRQSNPDALFITHPDGVIEVVSIAEAKTMTIHVGEGKRVIESSGVGRDYSGQISGVVLVATYERAQGITGSLICRHPEDLQLTDEGYKMFNTTLNVRIEQTIEQQAEYVWKQIKNWYEVANIPQWVGTITLSIKEIQESPLGRKVNIVGSGTPAEWANMAAIVSEVQWDLTSGTVQLQLGFTVEDPELEELEGTEPSEWGEESDWPASSESSSTEKNNRPNRSSSSSSSSESGSTPYYSYSDSSSESSSSEPPKGTGECGCEPTWESQKGLNAVLHAIFFYPYMGQDRYFLADRTCLPDWYHEKMTADEVIKRVMLNISEHPSSQ